jgi:hypothetical protein
MNSENSTPGVNVLFREYWSLYGGVREISRSAYFRFAFLIFIATFGLWGKPGWWADVLSILPGLMGISLAAFTLFLSAGSESFRQNIAGDVPNEGIVDQPAGEEVPEVEAASPFVRTAVVFLHFLVIQFIALILAICAKSFYAVKAPEWFVSINYFASLFLWGLSFLVFIYALSVVLAASFAVYEIVRWFDIDVTIKRENKII